MARETVRWRARPAAGCRAWGGGAASERREPLQPGPRRRRASFSSSSPRRTRRRATAVDVDWLPGQTGGVGVEHAAAAGVDPHLAGPAQLLGRSPRSSAAPSAPSGRASAGARRGRAAVTRARDAGGGAGWLALGVDDSQAAAAGQQLAHVVVAVHARQQRRRAIRREPVEARAVGRLGGGDLRAHVALQQGERLLELRTGRRPPGLALGRAHQGRGSKPAAPFTPARATCSRAVGARASAAWALADAGSAPFQQLAEQALGPRPAVDGAGRGVAGRAAVRAPRSRGRGGPGRGARRRAPVDPRPPAAEVRHHIDLDGSRLQGRCLFGRARDRRARRRSSTGASRAGPARRRRRVDAEALSRPGHLPRAVRGPRRRARPRPGRPP